MLPCKYTLCGFDKLWPRHCTANHRKNSMQSFKLSDCDTFWLEMCSKSKFHWKQQVNEDHNEWKKYPRAALNKKINRSDHQKADKIKLQMKWGFMYIRKKYIFLAIQSKLTETASFRWQCKDDFYISMEECSKITWDVFFIIYFIYFFTYTKKSLYSLHPVSCGAQPAYNIQVTIRKWVIFTIFRFQMARLEAI